MRKTIKTLMIQRLWGEVMRKKMIDDIFSIFIDLPQTSDRKDIEKYLKKCEEKQ